jgi:hypothetical protein
MKETKQHRPIDDIYYELCSHPDFVTGSYYTKDNVIDIIISQIEYDYDDDDDLVNYAEQIYKNNSRQIFKNIDGCYEYGVDHSEFLCDCDLTIEKQTK